MLNALRLRDFRLLWSARLVSLLGSWLLVVAVPAHVLLLTGSLTATGLTLAAEFLPPLLLGPLAGVYADRHDRRRLMIVADLARAVAVVLLLFVQEPQDVWLAYLALAVESTGTVFFRPAAQAHTPAVVGTGPLLTSANALNAITDGAVRLIGAPLGGALLAVTGFSALVWIDISTYLLSAAAIAATARVSAPAREHRVDIRSGLVFLRANRTAAALLAVNTLFLCANASLTALLVPFGVQVLGGTVQTGVLMSALGVRLLIGAPLIRLPVSTTRLLAAALALTGMGFALLFSATALPLALVAAVLVGAAGSLALASIQTTLSAPPPTSCSVEPRPPSSPPKPRRPSRVRWRVRPSPKPSR
ncbi:MFS transporter [Actinokineospora sp. NBRC 105648]|uniref:MFS transporter n=1 Tax=Actinokineospora sp. NBRC 105648 TaxID=3032206 RepID=UPI0024A1C4C7|nr:MFS transporter [Actinokineospora sp. NBRC 105648]GLZ39349.1 hypothetical protein Acsp05_29730 [Actinokineospora sp. NBRC 105648]